MNTMRKQLLASVVSMALLSPVMAAENHHSDCNSGSTVGIGKMGMVNEASLQAHIDKVKAQMKKVRHARGSHVSQKLELKRHLSDMQAAMQELHDQMYAEGCEASIHGASLETRIEVMEKRMGMMQQMMEQTIDHLSEQSQQ